MNLELTDIELRRLADLVYIGNWILNSPRSYDLLEDYESLQEKIFTACVKNGMTALGNNYRGHILPSKAFREGGIHDAIENYEDQVFYDILAEELSRRDMEELGENENDLDALEHRIEEYMHEFEKNELGNLRLVP